MTRGHARQRRERKNSLHLSYDSRQRRESFILKLLLKIFYKGGRMADEWGKAVEKSDKAYQKMIEAIASGNVEQFVVAREEYDLAEDECERATIRAGHFPDWPPRTEEGLQRIGLTREQVNEKLSH
jgi:hypothetical protein